MSAFISKKSLSLELKKGGKKEEEGVAEVHSVHAHRFIGPVSASFQDKKLPFVLLLFCFLRGDSIQYTTKESKRVRNENK